MAISPLCLLLVDDRPLVPAGVCANPQHQITNFQIMLAGCAVEARAIPAASPTNVVLLEMSLPGTNGLDLSRQLRTRHRRVKLIMLAAETDPWTVIEALQVGALGFPRRTFPGFRYEQDTCHR